MLTSIITSFVGSFLAFTLFFVLMMLRPKKKPPMPICAFCEAAYPTKEQMQEHIRTCPKHPLSRYASRGAGGEQACGFVPPTPGYAPCKRQSGHDGPCAHEFAPASPEQQNNTKRGVSE